MPGFLTRWLLRTRAMFSAGHDRALRDELQLHLHLLEEEYTAQGMPPEVARRRARHDFGNATLFQEASHDLFAFRFLEQTLQDVRYAIREIRRRPGFSSVAILSLAVGIGAVTAAFSVVDAFMLRSLPVRDPARLIAFGTGEKWATWPYVSFLRWRDAPEVPFEVAVASRMNTDVPLRAGGRSAEARVSLVSPNYFTVMGVVVPRGRALDSADATAPGTSPVAVISDAFWERWFGRAPDILTRTIELNGVRYEIVGVAGKGFTGPFVGSPADVWVPITMQPALMPDGPSLLEGRSKARWLTVIGRLPADVTLERAAVAAGLIHARLRAEALAGQSPGNPDAARAGQQPLTLLKATRGFAPALGTYSRPLMILSAITTLVLLIACANFTNLLLARSEGRRREFIIRLALGGGTWRLIRASATECVLLAAAAGALGLGLSRWATAIVLKQFAVANVPVELTHDLDGRVLAFTVACVAVVCIFGIWPCIRPARSASASSVRQPTNLGQPAQSRGFAGRILLIAQLVMCTMLLICAGLLLRTVTNLRSQDLGFDRQTLLISLTPADARHSSQPEAMMHRLREQILGVPGIQAVGMSGGRLLDPSTYWIDGSQLLTTDRGLVLPGVNWTFTAVSPGFFEAVGMTVVEGLGFDSRTPGPADAVVINRSLARFLFGDASAVGRQIRLNPRGPLQPIVGVVTDVKQVSPQQRTLGVVYVPLRDFGRVVLAVRTAGPPAAAVPVVTRQLEAIAGAPSIDKVRTVEEVLEEAIAQERLLSVISLGLSTIAMAIGCVGLYALMSYVVARRTRELAIRLALGATGGKVVAMVLSDSAAMVLPGLAIGVPLGLIASRPLSSQLYGVQTSDPWTLAAVALVLALVALAATLKPALTAARIDPLTLLRND